MTLIDQVAQLCAYTTNETYISWTQASAYDPPHPWRIATFSGPDPVLKAGVDIHHAVQNDIKVFSPEVWKGVQTRDTQLYEKYRGLATGSDRKPGLKTLARVLLGLSIQGVEHSSVEDAWATMELYRMNEGGIERAQSGATCTYNDTEETNDEDYEAELEDDAGVGNGTAEVAADMIGAVQRAAQMPLSAAASFWQGGISSIKTNLTSKKGGQPRAA